MYVVLANTFWIDNKNKNLYSQRDTKIKEWD